MIDLSKTSGLPIELKEDLRIKFNPPMANREPTYVRKFSQVLPVLLDPKIVPPVEETYLGYRALALPQDEELFQTAHLQYDLTIVPPLKLGREFNKTIGHYHANLPGTAVAHPEVYEVLHGTALFLIQKMDPDFKEVFSVYAIEAQTGEKVIYPPNYGHIMINVGNDVLVTANWLSTDYQPMYEPVSGKQGMAYYVVAGQGKPYDFIPNPAYGPALAPVRVLSKKFMANFPITGAKPIYTAAVINPKNLAFLNDPLKYAVELSTITS